jgi:hypothetical protein
VNCTSIPQLGHLWSFADFFFGGMANKTVKKYVIALLPRHLLRAILWHLHNIHGQCRTIKSGTAPSDRRSQGSAQFAMHGRSKQQLKKRP